MQQKKFQMNPYRLHDKLLQISALQFRGEVNHLLVKKPTKPGKARALGYKANGKTWVIRSYIAKGGITNPVPSRGRKQPSHCKKSRDISHQQILERRAMKNYSNLKCIGSYKVAATGKKTWYQYVCIKKL